MRPDLRPLLYLRVTYESYQDNTSNTRLRGGKSFCGLNISPEVVNAMYSVGTFGKASYC